LRYREADAGNAHAVSFWRTNVNDAAKADVRNRSRVQTMCVSMKSSVSSNISGLTWPRPDSARRGCRCQNPFLLPRCDNGWRRAS